MAGIPDCILLERTKGEKREIGISWRRINTASWRASQTDMPAVSKFLRRLTLWAFAFFSILAFVGTQEGWGRAMAYRKVSLNGMWELAPGRERPAVWPYTVPVPGLVDLSKPPLDWTEEDFFWYRTVFRLTDGDTFFKAILQLEQVQFGTEVWLNGNRIGGDIPCYTSQEFDLTPFLNKNGENELLVRVGAKHTLPGESAVGVDFEKMLWIPGIWGDVWLHLYGPARLRWVRILPDIRRGKANFHFEIEYFKSVGKSAVLECQIREYASGKEVRRWRVPLNSSSQTVQTLDFDIPLPDFVPWTPENPFLYVFDGTLRVSKDISHQLSIRFGMRQFEIQDGNFYLNGQRIVLRGSNIAFHRMLSDSTRGSLPWDEEWIRRALVDIPKQHNMFFFRIHLGHAYNRWYDIADEGGILLQDEWAFWTTSGSPRQIRREFEAWIRENVNHPSIVIWDPLNESEDSVLTEKIIPELRLLDPSRPWEYVDFEEDHPYIYSLGPVLNGRKFGYARSIFDLKNSSRPVMINEYLWWWLDREGRPTSLTEPVVPRWLGKNPPREQLLEFQAFLARELTELWRRLNADAIMPFVYLSVGEGPTANFFLGPLAELRPKPVLAALKEALSPTGVSIELWDRHFLAGEERTIDVFLFNDTNEEKDGSLKIEIRGNPSFGHSKRSFHLAPTEHRKMRVPVRFPDVPGSYELIAEIYDENKTLLATSRKPVFIFARPEVSPSTRKISFVLHDPLGEVKQYLADRGIMYGELGPSSLRRAQVTFVNAGGLDDTYRRNLAEIDDFVRRGGLLVIQEPEFGVHGEIQMRVLRELELNVQYRKDPERGGYDSYVFPEDPEHLLWEGIAPEHLRMFNGALGGEMVAQFNVRPNRPFETVASCNLELRVPAVMEIPYGKGFVVISRIQIRGRMCPRKNQGELFDRRYDPVAERYFLNLITNYVGKDAYVARVREKLAGIRIYIARIRASSGQVYDAFDGNMKTRWSSKAEDPQWIWIDFGRPTILNRLTIFWEVAYGKVYSISVSDDSRAWRKVFEENNSDGGKDVIELGGVRTRYLRLDFVQRGTKWGYSIWEMRIE